MPAKRDLSGVRFGRLVAIEPAPRIKKHLSVWRCRCDCGGEKIASTATLGSGKIRSCGCLRLELASRHDRTQELTYEEAKTRFRYEPETGNLIWVKPRALQIKPGTVAGSTDAEGYVAVAFGDKSYKVHRVVWLLNTGRWPEGEIDHIDCNPSNNRFENLREASRRENMLNSRRRKAAGLKGAHWNCWVKKWAARLCNEFLGYFETESEAHEAYMKAARDKYGDFARAE